ncbi:ABC transporter permease [Natronospora cellulosivora (SeqCode)]
MMVKEIMTMALNSLKVNRMRTFLSMLGIIIGVAAVIAIVSVGTGAQNYITSKISSLGSNLINISQDFSDDFSSANSAGFTVELADYINKYSPSVKEVLPNLQIGGAISHRDNTIMTTILGTSPAYQEIVNYYPKEGSFIRASDIDRRNDIIVLGYDLATELFPDEEALNQMVKINNQGHVYLFRVVGIMEEKNTGLLGNYNKQAYIPAPTFMSKLSKSNSVTGYLAQAKSSEQAFLAVNEITHFLSNYTGSSDSFSILSQDQIIDIINSVADTLNRMLAGIAGISLLVGGIGIMNIMLVSVTERTREIGIRKALGADKGQIMKQFVYEALFVSALGGIIGILLGWLGAAVLAHFGHWDLLISPSSIILAFAFSLLVGLFFGIYPALKASRLDPVEALSYE